MPWRMWARRDAGTEERGWFCAHANAVKRKKPKMRTRDRFMEEFSARGRFQNKTQLKIGSARIRFLVAAKIALHSAGASGGTEGSPIPVGASALSTKCTSTTGAS